MYYLTFDDLFRVGEVELLDRQPSMTRAIVEREVTDANALVAVSAAMGDAVMGQLIGVAAASVFDSATGEDLDRLAWDRYRLLRKQASAAYGVVQFSTITAAPSSFTISAGTIVGTQSGNKYTVVNDVTYPSGSTGPISATVRSVVAGASQQALPNLIRSILSNVIGSPGDLQVNNELATAGASDVEGDDPFKEYCRNYYPTLRRGTLAAVQQAGYSAPGVRSATAIELVDPNTGNPLRQVELFVTDDYTDALASLNVSSPSYATQSQAFAQSVFTSLSDTRPAGTYVNVIVAQIIMLQIRLLLAYQAGYDPTTVETAARAAVVAYTQNLKPGQTWSYAVALTRLRRIPGLAYTGNEIIVPSGDSVATPLQCIRSTMAICSAFGNGD